MVSGDEVTVRGVGVPESVTVKIKLLYGEAAAQAASWPMLVNVITPEELKVRHAGSALPVLETAHVYGEMPPLACKASDNDDPTTPVRLELIVVTAGAAGIVMDAVPVLVVSAIEVAVMVAVWGLLVAAGAV
jgi:hypothetical protein